MRTLLSDRLAGWFGAAATPLALPPGQEPLAFETATAYAELGRSADAVTATDRALALTRARVHPQTQSLYEHQRVFYTAGGRVAAASR